jgi:hypothetical protein
MKVGDLVAYAWNPVARPDEVDLAIVLDPFPKQPYEGHPDKTRHYVEILLQTVLERPLMVPAFKCHIVGFAR